MVVLGLLDGTFNYNTLKDKMSPFFVPYGDYYAFL